ncbi:MAG TPA: OmpA family protein [Polyangiaceae bacterium]|nr:OmpA family protein [Polyangiaceae bacterium]
MSNRLQPAQLNTPATRKIRMVDFETGKSALRPEHRSWIDQTVQQLAGQNDFWVYFYGFASKLGQKGSGNNAEAASSFNRQLSYDRANAAARYMEKLDARVSSRVKEFSARGSDDYTAPSTDNSAYERAVEVHVYLVPAPPPPPPHVDPVPPLPGGPRYSSWALAAPFSVAATLVPGAVAAANVVAFRCRERRDETRTYLVPGMGAGWSYTGPKLGKLLQMVKTILGSPSYSGMSFTDATAVTPFNFKDLEDNATCLLKSAGGGAIIGYQYVKVSVYGKLWYRETSGRPFFATRDFVQNVDCSGKDLQLGIGGAAVGGSLFRVA